MTETVGRYQLILHPTHRKDQFLLDTVSGATWQLNSFDKLDAWRPLRKLNNEAEVDAFKASIEAGRSS